MGVYLVNRRQTLRRLVFCKQIKKMTEWDQFNDSVLPSKMSGCHTIPVGISFDICLVLQGISASQKRLVGVRFKLTNSLIHSKLCAKVVSLSDRLSISCTCIVIYIRAVMKLIIKTVDFILLLLFTFPLKPYHR